MPPARAVRLGTPRLILREFRRSDWRAVHRWARDPAVVRYLVWGPNTPAQTRRHVADVIAKRAERPRRDITLAIALRATGELIGSCALRPGPRGARAGEIGYVLRRERWGRGYMPEAVRALLRLGFGRLGLLRIYATCDRRNTASARVLAKVGMRREARWRRDTRMEGRWRDTDLYAIAAARGRRRR